MEKRFRIVTSSSHGHVTDGIVRALESEVSQATGWPVVRSKGGFRQKLARVATRLSLPAPFAGSDDVFMVMMGPHRIPLNAADWRATKGKKVAWMFDVWPKDYDALRRFVADYGIEVLFVTAKQSADRMDRALERCEVRWCAEPFIDLGFRTKPWVERKTDVVQFGRKYQAYHDRFVHDIAGTDISYLYEEVKGQVVWPTQTEFVLGLSDAKVSVCFPCDMTHKDRAGDVSTVTQRYYQSFASGCLVVGQSPSELLTLFGYDPVVKADMEDPAAQIQAILDAPDRYASLIERNLNEVRTQTVSSRMETILRELP